MAFVLEDLPYAFDALEPHIDAKTMEIHHDRHHKAYCDNLNAALAGKPEEHHDIESILANISQHTPAVRNNGGGFWNHNFFWHILSPTGGHEPSGALAEKIEADFGGLAALKEKFNDAAKTRFGSGWAWLIVQDGTLKVCSTPNQDNPLMDIAEEKGTPILGLDVWEHAYYLHYQNRRPDYVTAFWNVVNWELAGKKFDEAMALSAAKA